VDPVAPKDRLLHEAAPEQKARMMRGQPHRRQHATHFAPRHPVEEADQQTGPESERSRLGTLDTHLTNSFTQRDERSSPSVTLARPPWLPPTPAIRAASARAGKRALGPTS